jgi:hypothetical protein
MKGIGSQNIPLEVVPRLPHASRHYLQLKSGPPCQDLIPRGPPADGFVGNLRQGFQLRDCDT